MNKVKIFQVDSNYAKSHQECRNIYRIIICDDGKAGKVHKSARIRPICTLSLEEFQDSLTDPACAFVIIDETPV